MIPTTTQWFWMMRWCKEHGMSPANEKNWEDARLAYKREQEAVEPHPTPQKEGEGQ